MKRIILFFITLFSLASFAQSSSTCKEESEIKEKPIVRCILTIKKAGTEAGRKDSGALVASVHQEVNIEENGFALTVKIIEKCSVFDQDVCEHDLFMKLSKDDSVSQSRSKVSAESQLGLTVGTDVSGVICRL